MAFKVEITKLVYGGSGLGRHEGKVAFIPLTAPGDLLEAEIRYQKRNYLVAEMTRILKPGSGRRTARCRYFGYCGGCQWQHLEYPKQVTIKRQILEDAFRHRFPETKDLLISMKASPLEYGYRSRARIQLRRRGNRRVFGFYRPQSHAIQDVEDCPLLRPTLNLALSTIRGWEETALNNLQSQEIDLICSEDGKEWKWAPSSERFQATDPNDQSIGDLTLRRSVSGFQYLVSPSVFFQANDFMLDELVNIVDELCDTSVRKEALDLFAGVGLFSLPLARSYEKVTAVDSSFVASSLCVQNTACVKDKNIDIAFSDVHTWLQGFRPRRRVDLAVMNPPRSGVGKESLQLLRECAPGTILYVACDPNTLIRDLSCLIQDYRIDFIQGLDLFPQTYHFETIVRLRRR